MLAGYRFVEPAEGDWMGLDSAECNALQNGASWNRTVESFNNLFVVIFIVELMLKLIGLGPKQYTSETKTTDRQIDGQCMSNELVGGGVGELDGNVSTHPPIINWLVVGWENWIETHPPIRPPIHPSIHPRYISTG